jgi:catechol 2,3-dioxygenase
MNHPLAQRNSLVFSHMGFYVRDLDRMARFYQDVMCFFETDRGDLGPVKLIFLSRDPTEHHQIVLATGRPTDLSFSIINQISLRVPDLATLREVHARVSADPDVTELVTPRATAWKCSWTCHGTANSRYASPSTSAKVMSR